MTSQRITAGIRDALISAARERKFAEEQAALTARQAAMEAMKLEAGKLNYRDIFKGCWQALETLPDGWLPTGSSVRAHVEGGSVVNVEFHQPMPIPSNKTGWGVVAAVIPADSPILRRQQALLNAANEWSADEVALRQKERELAARVRGVIESVTTTGRLKEIWPEVVELLPTGSQPAGSMLPAINLKDLNEELGLGQKEDE